MAKYDFLCSNCKILYEDVIQPIAADHNFACEECHTPTEQYFGNTRISIRADLPAHFNAALGAEVTGWRDMEEKAKILSDKQTREQGMEVRLRPVDTRDKARFGVNDVGLKASYDSHKDNSELRRVIKSV